MSVARPKPVLALTHKICADCKIDKPKSDYWISNGYMRMRCKDCECTLKRLNYHTKPEVKAYLIFKSHESRANKYNVPCASLNDITQLLNYTNCYYCKLPKDGTVSFEIDHIVPISKGGSSDVSNLVLACPYCNQAKSNRSLEQFNSWIDWIRRT